MNADVIDAAETLLALMFAIDRDAATESDLTAAYDRCHDTMPADDARAALLAATVHYDAWYLQHKESRP